MTLARNNTELWIGSGSLIVVLDPYSNTIKEQIESTSKTNRLISLMTSDGDDMVWTCERGMSFVTQWCVSTRTKLWEYQCNVENPVDRVLLMENKRDSVVSSPTSSAPHDDVFNEDEDSSARIAKILDLNPRPRERSVSITKQGLQPTNRTKSEVLEISSPINIDSRKARSKSQDVGQASHSCSPVKQMIYPLEAPILDDLVKPDGFVQRSLQKKPSLMCASTRSNKRSTRQNKDSVPSELLNNSLSRPRTRAIHTGKPIRVTGLIYTDKGTLWVGRTNGDILVLSVKPPQQQNSTQNAPPVGKVMAVLGGHAVRGLGGTNRTVTNLMRCPGDQVLALIKFDSRSAASKAISSKIVVRSAVDPMTYENYQLMKYNVWSVEQIMRFNEMQTLQHT